MRAIFLPVLFVLLCAVSYAQPEKTSIMDKHNLYDEKGDYYFDNKDFKKAIVYYNMAFEKDADNYYSVLKKAEAFGAMGLYDQAAESYRYIFRSDLHIPNEYRLEFAMLLLKNNI